MRGLQSLGRFRAHARIGAVALPVACFLLGIFGTSLAGATLGANDYPYASSSSCASNCEADPWGFYRRECVSFVAWRLNHDNGVGFSNNMVGPNGRRGHFGSAYQWKENAHTIGYAYNGTPTAGAVAWWGVSLSTLSGHVAYVDSVSDSGAITIEEYNWENNHAYHTRTIKPGSSAWPNGFIHVKDLVGARPLAVSSSAPAPDPPPATPNTDPIRLQGDFTGDGRADVVQITPRGTGTPTGVNLSMLQSTGSELRNVGLWYAGTDIDIYASRWLTGDFNGDGRADIAQITPRGNGMPSGINVTVLLSTGAGFTYAGLWYYSNDVDINTARFVVGDFTGDGRADVALVTPRGAGTPTGVNLSMLESTGWGLSNVGLWYDSTDVDVYSSHFLAGDFDDDGATDLAMVTPRGAIGTNITLLRNLWGAFSNVGLWEYDEGVDPTNSRFVAGDFTGDGRIDIALITSRGGSDPSGVNVSMLEDTGTALTNIGLWYYSNDVDIANSRYLPGDFTGDGRADIALATPRGTGTPSGVNLSMLKSTGWELLNVGLWYDSSDVDLNTSQWG